MVNPNSSGNEAMSVSKKGCAGFVLTCNGSEQQLIDKSTAVSEWQALQLTD